MDVKRKLWLKLMKTATATKFNSSVSYRVWFEFSQPMWIKTCEPWCVSAGAGSWFGRAAELRGKCRGGLLPHFPGIKIHPQHEKEAHDAQITCQQSLEKEFHLYLHFNFSINMQTKLA